MQDVGEGSQKVAGISVWYGAVTWVFPSPSFYWEIVEALQWDSVMEGIKLWWKFPWYCLQRWKSANCIEWFWARTHLHCQVFLGFIKGSQFNDRQQNWPGSQEGGGKCSMQETHRTSYWQTGKQASYCPGLAKLRIFTSYFCILDSLLLLFPQFT